MLGNFGIDFVAAQDSMEYAEFGGAVVFEIALAAVAAALTGGVGLIGNAAKSVKSVKSLQQLGDTLIELDKKLNILKKKKQDSGSSNGEIKSEGDIPNEVDVDKTPKVPIFSNLQKMSKDYIGEEKGLLWGGRKVTYLDDAQRKKYKLNIVDGKLVDSRGKLFDTKKAKSAFGGKGNAIFVVDKYGNIYASKKHAPGKFHHSSFLSGEKVASAGELVVEKGVLKEITRKSGHYKPNESHLSQFIEYMKKNNVNTNDVKIGSGF